MKKFFYLIGILYAVFFGMIGYISSANATQFIDQLSVGDFVIPDSTSAMDVNSTTQGSRPCPIMTEVQRDAIVGPATGLCVYNSTSGALNTYSGAAWEATGGGVDISQPPLRINDGMAYDRHSITLSESAGDILITIEKDGGGDIRFQLGGVEYTLDTTPAVSATLTEGASSSSPQMNYIYLDLGGGATPTLQTSTTAPTGEFVWIATALVPDSATYLTEGAYHLQRWSDTTNFLNDRGALSFEREKIRSLGATWLSGAASTLTITANAGSADNVVVDTTSASVKQLHTQTFPAFTSPTTYYIANDSVSPYKAVADLNGELTDALGVTMADRRFSLVLWGSVNHNGDSKLFINLPNCSYNNDADALNDTNTCAVSTVPSGLRGTAFLIGRIVLRHRSLSSGTWTNLYGATALDDLRGVPIGTKSIGGGGGSGVYSDAIFSIFNSVDDTKIKEWDLSAITTGNTRTITMADRDLDLAFPTFDYTDLVPASSPAYLEGRLFYDTDLKAMSYYNDESDVILNIGLENWVQVRNNTGVTILDGQAVYLTGAVGQLSTIGLAQADNLLTCEIVGVTTHSIENNTNGYVTTQGLVNDLNTSAFLDGDIVYLSATVAGGLTATPPTNPNCAKRVGMIAYAHGVSGKLLVGSEHMYDNFTTGSVIFANGSGELSQDNTNFFWDNTNDYLGLLTATPDSTLDVQGSISKKLSSITATDTMDDSDYMWAVDPAAATTINLPTASGVTGREYVIYAVDVDNLITVDAAGSETIGGAVTYVFSKIGEEIRIVSDGTNWTLKSSLEDGRAEPVFYDVAFERGESAKVTKSNANLVVANETTNPLRGTYSLKLTKDSGASRDGESWTIGSFKIPEGYENTIIQVDFRGLTGTNLDDEEVQIILNDGTNDLTSLDGDGYVYASTMPSPFFGRWQTTDGASDYTIKVLINDTTVDQWDITIDDIRITTQQKVTGTPQTDFVDYTPTLSASFGVSPTIDYSKWSQNGENITIRGRIALGTSPTSSQLVISMPTGVAINNGGTTLVLGSADTSGSIDVYSVLLNVADTTNFRITKAGAAATTGADLGAGAVLIYDFSVPVAGWSSSTVMSSPNANRYIYTQADGNAGTSLTANATAIDFNNIQKNTTGAWDGSQFTVQETGDYRFAGMVYTTVTGASVNLDLRVDGAWKRRISNSEGATGQRKAFDVTYSLVKDEVVKIVSDTNVSLSNSSVYHYINIYKLNSGNQTIAASEKVRAHYTHATGDTITNNLVFKPTIKVEDTHNAFNTTTGTFTAPKSGTLRIYASTTTSFEAVTSGEYLAFSVDLNSSEIAVGPRTSSVATGSIRFSPYIGGYSHSVDKGDTVEVLFEEGVSASLEFITNSVYNQLIFEIEE